MAHFLSPAAVLTVLPIGRPEETTDCFCKGSLCSEAGEKHSDGKTA